MNSTTFEMTVSIEDQRFAGAVGAIVLQAAAYAGCSTDDAARFARAVQDALAESLDEPREQSLMPIVVRRRSGPVEVVMNGRVLSLDVRG